MTTLGGEFLLNEAGHLEVHRSYNMGLARLSAKTAAVARHPSLERFNNLLSLKNTDLKALVREQGLEARCDLNNNPSMRRALYETHAETLELVETEISLSDGDAASIWKSLDRYLPIYTLFRSDRVSSDQDPEAQNPLKAAVARAVADLADELERLTAQVRGTVEETARRTIEQMQANFPDLKLANELTPKFQEPKWSPIFKIELDADDGVPLNKRGSGVRRLILMSFFQAEANRMRTERNEAGDHSVPVIYAVEEPETAQHPDNQARIVEALQSLVEASDQVFLTTHNPSLAELLPVHSVRFVDDDETGGVRVCEPDDNVLEAVTKALGVLPARLPNTGVKVAVMTEGKTDIDALMNFYSILSASGDLRPFDTGLVFWAFGGGETVKDWIERQYLDALEIPQVIIVDSDRNAHGAPTSRKTQEIIAMLAARADATAIMTEKREIENYLHPDALSRASGGTISFDAAWDLDFDRLPVRLGEAITSARRAGAITFTPQSRDGQPMPPLETAKGHCKKVITSYLFAQMTAEEIKQRSTRADGTCEVLEWFEAIAQHVR
jgi:hypothetical protein